jgi:hypothetical protein
MTAIAPTKQQANPEDSISLLLNTDQWISATWEKFFQILENPTHAESRCYYDKNQLRQMKIETIPVSSKQALDNGIIYFAIADLEEALKLSREKSQSEVGAWILQKYSHDS